MAQHKYLTGTINKSHLNKRLDQTLTEMFPDYSRSQIKSWILNGLVKVNGQVILVPKKKIIGDKIVEIHALFEKDRCWEAQFIPLNIIYEDEDILIINKPCNLVVHPGIGNTDGTLLNALLYYFPPIANVPRMGIVHRLDKDTTGLMVVAKTIPAQIRLVKAIQAKEIIREYEAVAIGIIAAGGTIKQPIARHATKRTCMAVYPMGKTAVTHYRIVEHFRAHTQLRLRLDTGRTHQIRVHMAYIKHPLIGDPLYGSRPRPQRDTNEAFSKTLHCFNRQALHATLLRLQHPITSIEMEWNAPLPQDMAALIAALKENK